MASRLPPFIADIAKRAGRQFVPRHLAEPRLRNRQPNFIKGVHNGQYFRYKIPPAKPAPKQLPKIPPPTGPAPHAFKSIPPPTEAAPLTFGEQASAWWKENWSVVVLNFGSLCTLAGFTRSDQVELRSLSVCGSLSFVIYSLTQKPLRLVSSGWSFLFAAVNAYKIASVMHERNANVVLDAPSQIVYQEYFMPHGVTPKQFEAIMEQSERLTFKKGNLLMKQGQQMEKVHLVVSGRTRAFLLNRHLTAASSVPGNKDKKFGGDSGAWIGEMAFLEKMWEKEQRKNRPVKDSEAPVDKAAQGDADANAVAPDAQRRSKGPRMVQALYSIQAMEDTEVLVWTHDDMGKLFDKSIETRSALTRAMSSAVVAKVVNFTVSRKNKATWSNWLDQISFKGGATYNLVAHPELLEDETVAEEAEAEADEAEPDTEAEALLEPPRYR